MTRTEDLAVCRALGVDAVGINLWSGSRRGLSLAEADRLLRSTSTDGLARIGVFVDPTAEEVREAYMQLRLDMVQVVGAPYDPLPGIPWMWVIRGTPALYGLAPPSPPDRILLDAAVPGYGGAGQTTDWRWARAAVEQLSSIAPVWLAGGITPDNAAEAIAAVRPAGLDVASGAEPPGSTRGAKDRDRIAGLLAACQAGRSQR